MRFCTLLVAQPPTYSALRDANNDGKTLSADGAAQAFQTSGVPERDERRAAAEAALTRR
jgi:hypothetical protein